MPIAAWAMLVFVASAGASPGRSANDPLQGLASLIVSGHPAEARTRLTEILPGLEQSQDERREATCRLLLGMAENYLGNPGAARHQIDEARKSFLALDDRFGVATALFALAQMERNEGRTEETVSFLEQALAVIEELRRSDVPLPTDTLILLATAFGASPEEVLEFRPEAAKPLLLMMLAALARSDLGAALVEAGQLEKAEVQLQQARRDAEPLGGLLNAILDGATGDLRLRQWRFDEARDAYRKAIYGVTAFGGVPTLPANRALDILLKLTEIDLLSGRPDDAVRWSERIVTLTGTSPLLQEWHASGLHHRGIVFVCANRLDDAAAALAEAAAFAAKGGDAREAPIRIDLGAVELLRQRPADAIASLERAIALVQTSGRRDLERAAWIKLAEAFLLSGPNDASPDVLARLNALASASRFPLATALLEATLHPPRGRPEARITRIDVRRFVERQIARASAMQVVPARQVLASMALVVRGQAAFRRGDLADAHECWTQALEADPAADHRRELLAAIGATHWLRGERSEAARLVASAAEGLGSTGDAAVEERLTAFTGADRRWYFELAIDALMERGLVEQAFESAERAAAWEARELLGADRLDAVGGTDASLVRTAETLRTQLRAYDLQAALRTQQSTSPIKLEDVQRARERYVDLLRRLSSSNPDYVATVRPEAAAAGAVREALPADATLVRYFVSRQGEIHAWVLERKSIEHVLLPSGAEGFERLIAPLLAKMRNRKLIIVPSASRTRFPHVPCPEARP